MTDTNNQQDNVFLDGPDMAAFQNKLEETKQILGVKSEEELKEKIPRQNSDKHGHVALVSLNDIAITENGDLTRTEFFENMNIDKSIYGNIKLTTKEARSLTQNLRTLTTGVNSVLPMRCTGEECPFSDSCWFVENLKAPIGKSCPVEGQLLQYHTMSFMREFEVEMADHSEVMLIQELSELIVYEMRISRVLGESQNASLMGMKIKFSPDGMTIEEETEHWAFGVKEKIKNRRMKILTALNATRASRVPLANAKNKEEDDYITTLKAIKDVINEIKDETPYEEVQFKESKTKEQKGRE